MPTDVSILMLRHGQSEWNAIQRWQGSVDSPLTDLGRQQAVETAWTLAGLASPFHGVWASDLGRAAETASIIAEALSLAAPRLDARLREAYAGAWEGLTPDEIEVGWPGWLGVHRRPDDFESFANVIGRVLAALADIAEQATDSGAADVLVVAHSGVIRSVIRHLGRNDNRVPNLGGVWLHASVIDRPPLFTLGDVFDPAGIVLSGVDIPGEDPGD